MKMRKARKGFKMVKTKTVYYTYFGKMPKIRYAWHFMRKGESK